jgi:hypothetical protein
LPEKTNTVVFVNVAQMVNLPPAKPHAEAMLELVLRAGPELRAALATLRLDPLKDIGTLTVAIEDADNRTLILHGRFDRDAIHQGVKELMAKKPDKIGVTKVNDLFVYEDTTTRDTVWSVVLDKETLLLSTNKELVIAAARGALPAVKLGPTMQNLLAGVEDTESVWAVFDHPRSLFKDVMKKVDRRLNPLGLPIPLPPGVRSLEDHLLPVKTLTVSVVIDKEINVAIAIGSPNRLIADRMALLLGDPDILRTALVLNPVLRLAPGDDLDKVVTNVQVKTDAENVSLRVKFASDLLAQIIRSPKEP